MSEELRRRQARPCAANPDLEATSSPLAIGEEGDEAGLAADVQGFVLHGAPVGIHLCWSHAKNSKPTSTKRWTSFDRTTRPATTGR